MAVTRQTLIHLRGLRVRVGAEVDDTTRALTRGWVGAWRSLRSQWDRAVADIVSHTALTGRPPSVWELNRIKRLADALQATEEALGKLADRAGLDITDAAGRIIHATADTEPRLISSQLPAGDAATVVGRFAGTVTPSALDMIVARTQGQITSTLRPLSHDAMSAVRRHLVSGVAAGDNPVTAARRMLLDVEGAFNGGLTRAITVARTEMLDAYRATSREIHAANGDILAGWTWHADLGPRCCASCWSLHGTEHPLSEPGPMDHVQGRCVRLPRTKSWRELGIDVDEPPSAVVDAQAKFWSLPPARQASIMGAARLELLKSGRIGWADLAQRNNPVGWRPNYSPRPVNQLRTLASRRAAAGEPLTPPAGGDSVVRARLRQAQIDQVRPVASGLAEVEELIFNEVTDRAFDHRLAAMLARAPQTRPIIDAAAAAASRQQLLGMLDDIARTHRLERVGRAGDIIGFDRRLHEAVPGARIRDGQLVEIFRPGYRYAHADDDLVQLFRAKVDEVDDLAARAARPAPRTSGGDFDARLARALADQDALDAAGAGMTRDVTGLTAAQLDALRLYQRATGYRLINSELRAGTVTPTHAGPIREIDAAMERSLLTSDVVVYRGVQSGRGAFGDRIDGDLTGATWTERAYISASADEWIADFRFASLHADPASGKVPMVMRLVVPKGTGAIDMGTGQAELELLLQRGLRMRVVKDHGVVDGVRRLDVEVLPATKATLKVAQVADDVVDVGAKAAEFEIRAALRGGNADQVAARFRAEWKRITGRNIEVFLPSKVSPSTVREHFEGLLRAAERFPRIELDRVGWWYNEDATYAQALTGEKWIQFGASWMRTDGRAKYLRTLLRDVESGFSPAGFTSPGAVAIHEYGHILHMGGQLDYLTVTGKVKAALRQHAEARGYLNPEGEVAQGLAARMEVSHYAATDVDELVAEAFGDVMLNGAGASPLSREIYDILEQAYRAQYYGTAGSAT